MALKYFVTQKKIIVYVNRKSNERKSSYQCLRIALRPESFLSLEFLTLASEELFEEAGKTRAALT